MIEQQVHPVPLAANAEPLLPADETEVVSHLHQEGLQVADERFFKVALRVLVLEVEELQDEGVLDLLLGPHEVFGAGCPPTRQHGGLVLREGCALVELGAYLPVKLSD